MALKAVLDSVDSLPADVKKEYVARDGKFYLAIEGDVPGFVTKTSFDETVVKLNEFRDNNRALNGKVSEQDAKLKTFEGVDPAEYRTMKTKLENVGAGDGNLAAAIEKAVKAAVDPVTKELDTFKASNKQQAIDLATKTFETSLREAAVKAGVDKKMLSHFVDYGLKTFKFEDGKFVPKKGDVPFYSPSKPAEHISVEEWAGLQVTEAPGFFQGSNGGGAGGDGGRARTDGSGRKVISADPFEFGKNIEGIAKGETIVSSS